MRTVNSTYFDDMNHQDKWYIKGLIDADGCNQEHRHVLSLVSKDEDLLEDVAAAIQYSDEPSLRSDGVYYLQWVDRHMSKRLSELGCVANKSSIIQFPDVREEYLNHYIRGYFDGDGCFSRSSSRMRFSICSKSKSFLRMCADKIHQVLNIHVSFYKIKNSNEVYQIEVSGNRQITKLMEWIYNEANLFLKRKRKKYQDAII